MTLQCTKILALGAIALGLSGTIAMAGLPAGVHHQTIWAPDFYGGKIVRTVIDQTVSPAKVTRKTLSVRTRSCNPNSVAVSGGALFVVCNSDFGGLDEVLVYDASTLVYERRITGKGTDGFHYFAGASLIGGAFDTHGNLWLSGYNSSSLYRVPSAGLGAAAPLVDRQVIHSPDSPAGLTFDASGAMWVVGQYSGGILLNFSDATINVAGTYLHNSPLNPNPSYCLSDVLDGCNPTANLFDAPEGVALFGGAVWVSNNGGNAPGKSLVRAIPQGDGTFKTSVYGGTEGKPFSCPGGMFAPTLTGATAQLWVNDEGFGQVGTDCGASAAFQGTGVGRVMAFQSADLLSHKAAPTPEVFVGSTKLLTGSPGFGGIFVQLD